MPARLIDRLSDQASNDKLLTGFKVGRLKGYLGKWRDIGAPERILKVLDGKSSLIPLVREVLLSFGILGMNVEISNMIQEGILEESQSSTGFVSRMFTVPKTDGSRRSIFNLRALNHHLKSKTFRLLNHIRVPSFLQSEDYMTNIDISQAYFHIPIKERYQKFLSMVYKEKVYQMTCLPFGLASEPLEFAFR